MSDMYYPISAEDEKALRELAAMTTGGEYLEIGCGRSTEVLASMGSVDTVDVSQPRLDGVKARRKYFSPSSEFTPEQKYDLIFIDGDHRYNYVSKDIDNLLPFVNEGGVLCGHDYDRPDHFEEYIHVDYVRDRHNGVIKAVNERFGGRVLTFEGSSVWGVRV